MKRVVGLAFFLLLLTGCASTGKTTAGDDMVKQSYRQISQTEAAEMMTKADGHVVVDVRRQDEYDAGHRDEKPIGLSASTVTKWSGESTPDFVRRAVFE